MSFTRYPNYKDSGVEWLGEVPEHWDLKPLWTFFRRVKRTGFDDEQLLSVYRDHGVVLKASRADNFNKPSDDLSVYQLVVPGDLAINKMKAWQGSVAISEHRGIVSPAYFVYEALHSADSRYLHYLMRSLRYITGYMSVSKGIRVNQWDLEPQLHSRMPLTVPPLPEQTQIAAFLDRETEKIDELVAEQRRLMELLKEKRQAGISHAVTQGLNPHAPMKPSGIEWLGDVPVHWEVMSLRRCSLRVQTGGTPSSEPPSTDIEDGLVWYTPGDFGDSLRLTMSDRKISRSVAESGEAKVFPPGSALIVSIGATLGKVGFAEAASSGNQQINAVIPNNRIDGYFLTYSLLVKTEVMRFLSNASTIGIMNQEKTKQIWLSVPPRKEQENITAYLDTESAKFDTLTTEAQHAIALLQERRTALISAAVTGQIDVRPLCQLLKVGAGGTAIRSGESSAA